MFNPDFANKAAEHIYNLIPKPEPQPGGNQDKNGSSNNDAGNNPGEFGEVEDAPAQSESEKSEEEAKMKQVLSQAVTIAKRQGNLPAGLERFINEILKPKIDWREVLAHFLVEITRNDYTWKKPNTRYLQMGLYLPCLESEEPGKVVLIVDTSGSIDEDLLNQFAGEANDIATTFGNTLTVIYVDTKVCGVQDIEPDEPVKLNAKGGGGTDFRPGFNYIEEQDLQPRAVVYITDGCCTRFPAPPDYPVLWAQFGDAEFTTPFGEVVTIN